MKRTGKSKSALKTIKYIEPKNNKPHKNDNGIKERNLLTTGINCRSDTPSHTYQDFKYHINRHNQLHHESTQTYNFVISSRLGDFNPKNPEDVYRFNQYATGFAKRAFGTPVKDKNGKVHRKINYQILIAIQADNARGILHAHLIVNNTNLKTNRALPSSKRDIYHLRRANDEEVKSYNHKFSDKPIYDLSKHYHKDISPRQDHIITLLHNCMNDPKIKSQSAIRREFKDNGISFSVRRPKKVSKYTRKSYRKSSKKHNYRNHRGVVFIIRNGKTYKQKNHQKYNNKKTYIKLSSLSWAYKKKYHRPINYGLIKHNFAMKRLGKFKPQPQVTSAQATSIESKASSIASSNVSHTTNTKNNTHRHFTPMSSISENVNTNNQSDIEPTPQMTFKSSSNSDSDTETESESKPISIHAHYKSKTYPVWSYFKPINHTALYRRRGLHHNYYCYLAHFHIPYFRNKSLNSIIHEYENAGGEEEQRARAQIDNFESNCTQSDKEAIEDRLNSDFSYNKAVQSCRDFQKDRKELQIAKDRSRYERGHGFRR